MAGRTLPRMTGTVVRPHTGLRVPEWRGHTDLEVVEAVLSDLESTDRERDLAQRLLLVLDHIGETGPRKRR